MALINLLPWREERRRRLIQEFARQTVLVALFAVAVGGYAWYYVNGMVDDQKARNGYLEEQIAILQEDIKEIRKLESTKDQLLARMNVIQELQGRRPQIVHLFFELADTLPEGVHLTAVKQNGDNLTVRGKAISKAQVSAYMRNLTASAWLENPRLEVVQTGGSDRVNAFTLHLGQTTPKGSDTQGGKS